RGREAACRVRRQEAGLDVRDDEARLESPQVRNASPPHRGGSMLRPAGLHAPPAVIFWALRGWWAFRYASGPIARATAGRAASAAAQRVRLGRSPAFSTSALRTA